MTTSALTGSDKQTAWAEKIRAEKLAELPAFWAKVDAMQAASKGTPEQVAEMRALLEKAAEELAAQTEARFWIDERDTSAEFLIKTIARRLRG